MWKAACCDCEGCVCATCRFGITILKGQCVPAARQSTAPLLPQHGLVLDVGSNFGYYALYAAAHGCRCGHPLLGISHLGLERVM